MNKIREKLVRYMDAGFPILYLNTFEEDKVDEIITSIRLGKDICEWNEINGLIDCETKTPRFEDFSLEQTLDYFKVPQMLDRQILLLKDVTAYLEDPKIVSKIKGLARLINQPRGRCDNHYCFQYSVYSQRTRKIYYNFRNGLLTNRGDQTNHPGVYY